MAGNSGPRRLRVFRALAANRGLLRIAGAYGLFILTEFSAWTAMLVYAFSHGGATAAGLVALVQLLPGTVLAPVFAGWADRRSPVALLAGGYLVQAVAMAATAAAISAGVPLAAYAAAVVTATAVTTTRPAQSVVLPSLAVSPDQLTAANVTVGWVEATGVAGAGLLTGLLIALGGVAVVFAVCAGIALTALALVARLRVGTLAQAEPDEPTGPSGAGAALRIAARQPRLRLMLLLLTAEAVVVGALDLLFVVLAVDVLGRPQAWVGYLNAAYGAGGVLAASLGVLLVARRLGGPILGAALLLSVALAAMAAGTGVAGTVALLVVVGASRTMLDVASRSLLQRSVKAELLGRVFGLLEGLDSAGLAVGALLVPLLVHLGGARVAILGVAAVLPLVAIAGGRGLFSLDSAARVPVVETALLRSIPLFRELPPPTMEGLAASLTPVDLPAGTVLLRQGDPGDAYYAIADGVLDITQDERLLRQCGRGEGVGEIALLRAIPRTATVTASTPATVYRLGRDEFLTAVVGHAGTQRQADRIAADLLAGDAARGGGDAGPDGEAQETAAGQPG